MSSVGFQLSSFSGIFKDKKTRKDFAELFRKTKQLEYTQQMKSNDAEISDNDNDNNNDIKVPPQKLTITIIDSRDKTLPWEQDDYNF